MPWVRYLQVGIAGNQRDGLTVQGQRQKLGGFGIPACVVGRNLTGALSPYAQHPHQLTRGLRARAGHPL